MPTQKEKIDHAITDMVNAFLRWPLPESVSSDTCCNRPSKGRTGTNLLTCPETIGLMQEVVRPIIERQFSPSDSPWLEVAHFLPDAGQCVLMAWDRGNKPVTMQTGHFVETSKGGRWVMSGGIKPKTPPNYFRELPSFPA